MENKGLQEMVQSAIAELLPPDETLRESVFYLYTLVLIL